MGTKRGQGRGSFVTSVLDLLDGFYGEVVQGIKPWAGAPPKLRSTTPDPPEPVVPAALASTSLSSQDGPETGTVSPEVPERADEVLLETGPPAASASTSSAEVTAASEDAPALT